MTYLLHLLIYFSITAIVAMSLNVVVGYCGRLTLAHAGFYAVGGYAYALLATRAGWGFIPCLLVGALLASVLSLSVSLPSWRFQGDFFVVATLAVQAWLLSALSNWHDPMAAPGTLRNLTNGTFGISGIPRPRFLGSDLSSIEGMATLSLATAGLCGVLAWLLLSSPWGRLLKAIRDDELAARSLGKRVRLAKVQAFAVSSGLVAVAGVLYASYVGYLDPSSASLNESILMLSVVIVGGGGNQRGPIVGALVILLIPEALRFMALGDAAAANLRLGVYGLLLILIMHVQPEGLAGEYRIE